MPDRDQMARIVDAYIDGFNRGDAAAITALFAEDATVADPVGAPVIHGRAAITAFYETSVATGAKLRLDGPVRVAADTVAFAFGAHVDNPGAPMRIDVIDTFRFDADGRIAEMRAHWDQANVHMSTTEATG